MNNMINENVFNLCNVERYNGQPKIQKESVSDHVFRMQMMAIQLVSDFNSHHEYAKFDLGIILQKILMHDVPECLGMADLQHPVKHRDKEFLKKYDELSSIIVEENLGKGLAKICDTAKDLSPCGRLVAILDIWELIKFLKKECELGNHSSELRKIISNAQDIVTDLKTNILKVFSNSGNTTKREWLISLCNQAIDECKLIRSKAAYLNN